MTSSPCNPSLCNNTIARSPLPHRTVQVYLRRLLARQTALCGPIFDVTEVRRALFCHHGHRLFGDTLERLGIASGAILDVMLNTRWMYNTGFYALAKSPVV